MSDIELVDPGCRRVLPKLDSYLDGELLTESNLEVLQHCGACAGCQREVQERMAFRERLKRAARGMEAPAGLADRVRSSIRRPGRGAGLSQYVLSLAAALALYASATANFGIGLAVSGSRVTFRNNQERVWISPVSRSV